jgi:PAS domain S-box/diguanylate cyclase (GGDEF) domain
MKGLFGIFEDPAILLTLVLLIISICIVMVVIILLYRLENEKRITKAAIELRKITNSFRAGLVHFLLEDDFRILYTSQGFYDILGYDKTEAKEQNKNSLMDFIDPEDSSFVGEIKKQVDNDTIHCDVRMISKEGSILNMLMTGNCTIGKDGKHTYSVVFIDITDQKKMQETLLLESERYRIATELSQDVIFEYDICADYMIYTNKYKELFGTQYKVHNFYGTCNQRRDYIHPDDWGIYLELCQHLKDGKNIIEAEYRKKDRLGDFIWCQILGKTIYDDNKQPIRVIGKLVNIDMQKRELESLEYRATRDPLTGVYNKEVTIKKIDKYLTAHKVGLHMLMFVDFDDFKSINDHYGHLQGDKILIYVISRIKEVFSEGEIIGRIGGDEFVVFAGDLKNIEEGLEKAALLKKELDTNYESGTDSIRISASIGLAIYPEDGLYYEQLIDRADQALYYVKEQGKNNYMLFSSVI